MKLLKFELLKIIRNKTSQIAFFLLILLMLGLCIGYVQFTGYVLEDGNTIHGIQAIHSKRETKREWTGIVTEDVIARVIGKNKAIVENPDYRSDQDLSLLDVGYAKQQGFYDIRNMINQFCRKSFNDYDYYAADRLVPEDAQGFYQKRIKIFEEWLGENHVKQLFSAEKSSYILHSVKTLETPFSYAYSDGWKTVLEMNVTLLFGVVVVICILMASNFSIEYQTKSDAVFNTTRYGKSKGNRIKIVAGFILTTAVYWGIMLVGNVILLSVFGFEGGNNPIQIEFWKSIYNITLREAWAVCVLLGYIGCLAMCSITMFLSARFQSSFAAIILSFLIIMVPAMFAESVMNDALQKVLSLFPHGAIMAKNYFTTYILYQFGEKVIPSFQMLPVVHLLATVVFIPLTYRSAQKYSRN